MSEKQLPILDCQGCGVCCLHMGYPAFNLPMDLLEKADAGEEFVADDLGPAALADLDRWGQMPPNLRGELLQVIQNYQPPPKGTLDQVCVWLDPGTRLCRHHTHRPQVCRDFEIGCQQCLDWRQVYADLVNPAENS